MNTHETQSAVSSMPLLAGWVRDYAVLHKWDEKYHLDLGIIQCWVKRSYDNHDVFEAGISGRYGRWLKRKFETADKAKLESQKLATKAAKQLLAALEVKPANK